MTKILHLCSDYAGTPLYQELVESLHTRGIDQVIYVPVRSHELVDRYRSELLSEKQYCYSKILNPASRLNYFGKINRIYNDVISRFETSTFNLTHAHFLFSDGGVAYKLKKEFNIDYIVTVRNTDINIFFRYMIHTRRFGLKILEGARKIVFLSPNYLEIMLNRYVPENLRRKFKEKSVIIPNGINEFWLKNLSSPGKMSRNTFSLIYVGEFSRNKNIKSVIKALDQLLRNGNNAELKIIGEYGDNVKQIKRLVKVRQGYITSIPRITERYDLLHLYRSADIFIMPSLYETFGLAYVEAMSQGLPVIYSKGQGFAGLYEDGKVGFEVEPKNIDEIVAKIELMAGKYEEMSKTCIKEAENYSWDRIALKFISIYKNLDTPDKNTEQHFL